MLKRPKPGDDENDILRMQEEYLRDKSSNNFEPAAKVINVRNDLVLPPKAEARILSKYAQAKGLKSRTKKTVKFDTPVLQGDGDVLEKNIEEHYKINLENEDKIHSPLVISSVLGNIVEKNVDYIPCNNIKSMPAQGFPAVLKHEEYHTEGIKSIFSQHFSKHQSNAPNSMDVDFKGNLLNAEQNILNIPTKSYIIQCEDADTIHKENVEKLKGMSELEILEEQKNLHTNLNPDVIAFIKSKRNKVDTKVKDSLNTTQSIDTSATSKFNNDNGDESLWDNDVLSHPNLSKWINFSTYEKEKLSWLKGIEGVTTNIDEPYEARFDFKGYLLPYTMEYCEQTKTLFHHGEEPNRPGYSLSELIGLSRSTVIQQRVMALNAIAGILEHYMTGIYKNVIEIPLSKLLFIIRFALDENKIIILEPALKAMRNLLYHRIDEVALDGLIGTEYCELMPSLENNKSEIVELESKEEELKDFHLAEIDLISAVLRTEIVQRLYYILFKIKPDYASVQYTLQILIRLIRDSEDSALKIMENEHLMSTIITNFIPPTSINFCFDPQIVYKGKPILIALKFLRVLSIQSKKITDILVKKYCILKPLLQYINSEVEGTYGLRIQVEAFCILSNLISYGIAVDEVLSLLPLIALILHKHVDGTDITDKSFTPTLVHASALLQLINKILQLKLAFNGEIKSKLCDLIIRGMRKWVTQMGKTSNCDYINLASSVLDCSKHFIESNIQITNYIGDSLLLFQSSNGYKSMTGKLMQTSNLISEINTANIHQDKNIMSLATCVINYSQPVIPILNRSSPILFLSSIFNILHYINKPNVSKNFVDNLNNYLLKLINVAPSLCTNWFTRIEVDFVFRIITTALINKNIEETQKDIIYVIANKLCYILRIDKRFELDFLFNKIVFNKDWFTAERLMKMISVSDSSLSISVVFVEKIKNNYKKVINFDHEYISTNVLRKWQEPILPRDWIYLPILNLYSKSQELLKQPIFYGEHAQNVYKLASMEKETILYSTLQWILFNEICFADLLNDIDLTDRFCRIMCVFLCDNSLFLEPKIDILLHNCIQILFRKEKENNFNFDKSLAGLSNFQDLYTQFLEQFQAVSYGNENFATCVLVPLAQKHNVKWRKLVWSEYAGCLRALDCPLEHLCYNLDSYLYPDETDESLIRCYSLALSSNLLRSGTVSHKIASHHVTTFKNKSK